MEFKILNAEILGDICHVFDPNTKVKIDAVCLDDDVVVSITIKKECMYDRNDLKNKLLKKHKEIASTILNSEQLVSELNSNTRKE